MDEDIKMLLGLAIAKSTLQLALRSFELRVHGMTYSCFQLFWRFGIDSYCGVVVKTPAQTMDPDLGLDLGLTWVIPDTVGHTGYPISI